MPTDQQRKSLLGMPIETQMTPPSHQLPSDTVLVLLHPSSWLADRRHGLGSVWLHILLNGIQVARAATMYSRRLPRQGKSKATSEALLDEGPRTAVARKVSPLFHPTTPPTTCLNYISSGRPRIATNAAAVSLSSSYWMFIQLRLSPATAVDFSVHSEAPLEIYTTGTQ